MAEDQRPPAHQQTGNQSEFLRSLMRALPGLTSEVRQNLEQLKADEERKKKVLEASWLTYVIGDREHAPSRVAFIVIVLAMLLLLPTFYLIIIGKDQSPLLDKIVTGIFSLASGALGFLFGQYMADRTPRTRPRR